MIEVIKANRLTCEKCGHVWISETEPDRCAKCKRWNWNTTNKEKTNDDTRGTGSSTTGEIERGRDEGALPDVRQAESPAERLRAVQPVRHELATGRGLNKGCPFEPCLIAGHKSFLKAGEWKCMMCK